MTTIHELAKKCGVSVATVSRALNLETRSKVAPGTARRIDELVKKHRYTPNLAAKNLRKTSFRTIGVLIPHLSNVFSSSYYQKILSGVSDTLLESDYHFKLILLNTRKGKWDDYQFRSGEGVDGLVVTHWPVFFSSKESVQNFNLPCAIINDPEKNMKAYFVAGDNISGGELAARHLLSKGHRKIGVMTGAAWSSDSRQRLEGFQKELKKHGVMVRPDCIVSADFMRSKAFDRVESLLVNQKKLTALFCLNDDMAMGVLDKLKQMKIDCPGQLSVVGYDDEWNCQYAEPALTTVHVPIYEMARDAGKRLLDYLNRPKGWKVPFEGQTLFPVSLVERDSVRKG